MLYTIDSTIVNVALPHMQGSLQATQDQSAWILTSYIVVSAIMTPLAGWLGTRFGLRPVMLWSIAGFTLGSMLCGLATSLEQIVAFRILQGAAGAALVPLSQVVLLQEFPREQHARVTALWGMGVMVGPVIGPTLGGWLTDELSWRWAFYINVPVGLLVVPRHARLDAPRRRRRAPPVRRDRLRAAVAGARPVPADARPRPDQRLVRVDRDRRRGVLRGGLLLHVHRALADEHAAVRRLPACSATAISPSRCW